MIHAPTLPPPEEITPADAIEYLRKLVLSVARELEIDPDELGTFGPVIALYVLEREMLGWQALAQNTDSEPKEEK